MNKKLMAVAVAGALAAPGVALAQASSVTISGYFKVGLENFSVSNPSPLRLNSSQMRVVDNSSRILFNMVEGLGNGMDGIAQLDIRFDPGQAVPVAAGFNPIGSGNTFLGLRSKSWGQATIGRHDLHWGKAPDEIWWKAGATAAAALSLFDFIGPTAVGAFRSNNSIKYEMPAFGGFNGVIGWTANPVVNTEGDMSLTNGVGVTTRKGDGWNINPSYTNGPLQVGYSYWSARPDAPVAATNDQRADSLYGHYVFGGLKIGLGWNRARLNGSTTGAKVAERTAWSLPVRYNWGPHTVVGHYTRAGDISSDVVGAVTSNTGANMVALAYVYDLSKRTSLALTYAKINNDSAGAYNFFANAAWGSPDGGIVVGVPGVSSSESPRMLQATIKHAF